MNPSERVDALESIALHSQRTTSWNWGPARQRSPSGPGLTPFGTTSMKSLMFGFARPRLLRRFLLRNYCATETKQLAILVKVVEDYCFAHDITDKTEQADTARLVMILYEVGLTTAEEFTEALHRLDATTIFRETQSP